MRKLRSDNMLAGVFFFIAFLCNRQNLKRIHFIFNECSFQLDYVFYLGRTNYIKLNPSHHIPRDPLTKEPNLFLFTIDDGDEFGDWKVSQLEHVFIGGSEVSYIFVRLG